MTPIEALLRELDEAWPPRPRTGLRIIGSTALMLQAEYERGTKDGDVLEAADLSSDAKASLIELAGPNTEMHARCKIYIDIVGNGLPFLPRAPAWHPVTLVPPLAHLDVHVLDVVDVVVTKLKRFSANDRWDIEAMIDLDLVPHDRLVERFRSAVDAFAADARAEDLPRYVRNLHQIERDSYLAPETLIDLPSWIE